MLTYEIEGGNLPVVICHLDAGDSVVCEGGAMSWMSPNMKMMTKSGGIGKFFGRMFSGESLFMNEYIADGAPAMIAFASSFPGSIIPYRVSPGNAIIIQKSGFLAMERTLDLSVHFQRRFGAGLFGGEGFILQRVSGDGLVFIEIDGYCKEYELSVGESIIVDTGHLAAMSESCTMEIQTVKGIKNKLLGGEGFFNTKITGPGKVYIQSMPISKTAEAIIPYLPTRDSGDRDINIDFGNN